MSADNGLILWRDGDDYVLSEYNASHDDFADKGSMTRRFGGQDLERMLLRAQEIMREEVVEYGLSLDLGQEAVDETGDAVAEIDALGPRSRPSSLSG